MQLLVRASGVSEKVAAGIAEAYPNAMAWSSLSEAGLRRLGASASQAKRLAAIFELCRAASSPGPWTPHLRRPAHLADYIRRIAGSDEQENFIAVLLDSRQKIIDVLLITRGTMSQVDVHPRELFKDAIRLRAHSMLIAHNHPSGESDPSEADLELTNRMAEVGKLVGIPVLDHLVVTPSDFFSLAAHGMMPSM